MPRRTPEEAARLRAIRDQAQAAKQTPEEALRDSDQQSFRPLGDVLAERAAAKVLFYPAWISNHAGDSGPALKWGKPCDTPGEARRIGMAEVDGGRATLSFVVRFAGGEKVPLARYVHPKSARRIIEHWEQLLDATEGPEESQP